MRSPGKKGSAAIFVNTHEENPYTGRRHGAISLLNHWWYDRILKIFFSGTQRILTFHVASERRHPFATNWVRLLVSGLLSGMVAGGTLFATNCNRSIRKSSVFSKELHVNFSINPRREIFSKCLTSLHCLVHPPFFRIIDEWFQNFELDFRSTGEGTPYSFLHHFVSYKRRSWRTWKLSCANLKHNVKEHLALFYWLTASLGRLLNAVSSTLSLMKTLLIHFLLLKLNLIEAR